MLEQFICRQLKVTKIYILTDEKLKHIHVVWPTNAHLPPPPPLPSFYIYIAAAINTAEQRDKEDGVLTCQTN
jgi:hypothetical protein